MKSRILGLLAFGLLVSSASQAQTAATPVPAETSALAAPAADADTSVPAKGAETQAAVKRPKAPPGYKLGKRYEDGTYVYCREFSRVGTRFKEKLCLTPEEYEDVERRNQKMRESMQQPIICANQLCRSD